MGQCGIASPIPKMNDYNEIAAKTCWRQRVRGGVTTLDLLLSPAGIGETGIIRFRNVQIRFFASYRVSSQRALPARIVPAYSARKHCVPTQSPLSSELR